MPDMQEIESKDLVLRITGEVQSSNMVEFEQTALQVIASINLELETDEDFVEAEQNIKSCSLIETRIHNARQDAIHSTADIAALITTTEKLEEKFREVRLKLNGKVKTEKEKRKTEIVNKAESAITATVNGSPVKDFFSIDFSAIKDAVKNKRSLAKMQEAIDEVLEGQRLKLEQMEQNYTANTTTIETAAKEYPGLFPDAKNLALSPAEIVAAQIDSRIATYKYEIEMKEKAAKELAEEEKAKEEASLAEEAKAEREPPVVVESPEEALVSISPPPFPTAPPFPPSPSFSTAATEEPASEAQLTHTAAVLIVADDIDEVLRQIRRVPGVISVN